MDALIDALVDRTHLQTRQSELLKACHEELERDVQQVSDTPWQGQSPHRQAQLSRSLVRLLKRPTTPPDDMDTIVAILALLSSGGKFIARTRVISVEHLAITVQEPGGTDIGARTWQSSILLGRALVRGLIDVTDKVVVELGCGTGVTGMAAYHSKAAMVYFTDGDAAILETTRENVARNCEGLAWEVLEYDWAQEPPTALTDGVDVVLAADVVYAPEQATLLCQAIERLVKRPCVVCVVLVNRSNMHDAIQLFQACMDASPLLERVHTGLMEDMLKETTEGDHVTHTVWLYTSK